MQRPSDIASRSAELARLTAHLDSLQHQSDEDIRVLRDVMISRLMIVEASLLKLKDAIASQHQEARGRCAEAQLGALSATGDAADGRLAETMSPNSDATLAQE